MRVKICGITKPEQGRAIAQMGATALGFVCVPQSPRYISPDRIRAIVDYLPRSLAIGTIIDRIGVFADSPLETIAEAAAIANLNGIQLHGQESPQFCRAIKERLPHCEVIKALRVRAPEALKEANIYASSVDTLLLDAYHPNQLGGTGKTLDWASLRSFKPDCPWMLAGGLNADNVANALRYVKPQGIDLSSGVEHKPGDKDLEKVVRLLGQVRAIRMTQKPPAVARML